MPTVTLERAMRFTMQSNATGRDYDIAFAEPLTSPVGEAPAEIPIMVVLDSSLTFGTALERSTLYAAMGSLEPAIIVGVGYPGDIFSALQARTPDFTPPTPAGKHSELAALMGDHFGDADAFVEFLVAELAPEVRRRVRDASPTRLILHGFSLAGLLAAYALVTRPAAFETFSIISPSLWWNDFVVPGMVSGLPEKLAATGARPRVLVGVGALEQEVPISAPPGVDLEQLRSTVRQARMIDAAREFAEALASLPTTEIEFELFGREDHAGALTAGTGRAVSFALRRRSAS